jgi:hypothetical protein
MSNPRNPRSANLSPALQARAPKTLVEMQIVVDRVFAELAGSVVQQVRIPLERTVPDGGRGVILTLSKSTLDIFGKVIEFEVPKIIFQLVHDGQQPFTFSADIPSSLAVARLVERARRLRVDVFITRNPEQFAELRTRWRV